MTAGSACGSRQVRRVPGASRAGHGRAGNNPDQPNFRPRNATLKRMRNPLGDGADQRRSRRRDKAAAASDRGEGGPSARGEVASPGRRDREHGPVDGSSAGSPAGQDATADASRGGDRAGQDAAADASRRGDRAGRDTAAGPAGRGSTNGVPTRPDNNSAAADRRADGWRGSGTNGKRGSRSDAIGRGDSGKLASSTGRPPAAGSVFAPGYDASRPESADRAVSGSRTRPSTTWYGSTAGGAAGKGPVRGYPPGPGQPPPMYPPGQFAAWNRGPGRSSEPSAAPGLPARGQPGGAQSGPHTGPVAPAGSQPGGTGPDAGPYGQRAPAGPDSRAGSGPFGRPAWQATATDSGPAPSRYYGQDLAADAEPGYSMLAVSDPAADVTSTQTWQAVGDGRATGTWTAPANPGTGPAAHPGRGNAAPEPEPEPTPDPERAADRHRAEAGPGRSGSADLADPVGCRPHSQPCRRPRQPCSRRCRPRR